MIRAARYAGFWRRAAALGVDALWLFCVTGALGFVLFGDPWPGAGAAWVLRDLLPALVFVIGWAQFGATPGKLLLDLRVVDVARGERPGYVRAIIRYLGYFVSFLTLGLGFLWVVFDRRSQALHDKLAGTCVIVADDDPLAIDPAAMA